VSSTPAASAKASIPPPPPATRARFDKAGIPWQDGYPHYPPPPKFVQDVEKIRKERERDFTDPGTKATEADKEALFSAAKEVRNLSHNIGTEIVGLQLKDLNPSQLNALARLISERTVVFLRDQDLSPQKQKEIGLYLGDGLIEIHPQAPQVPTVEGVSIIWEPAYQNLAANKGRTEGRNFRSANRAGTGVWHTDLVHESFPPSYTHLHQDTVPPVGGDTFWASGYSAYDKLSPAFRALIEPLKAVYISAHKYLDENNPDAPPKNVERVHPLVRTHPVTGWKSLYVNRAMTSRIEGLDKPESDLILNYLFDVYERNQDIQIRWHWTPGTSAIWDNRISIHSVSWDYEGKEDRHGTRVSSLAERPFFEPESKSRRESLGLGP